MVRNEARALPRLLRSAAGIIDGVVLTDTGSTDGTVAAATALCQRLGIPVDVSHDTWSDFGLNRTKNIAFAQEVAKHDPDTYLLLLDADMEVPVGTQRPSALPEVGMLPQRTGAMTWWNIRVIRADVAAAYVGRTHEYISHKEVVQKCEWFTIQDRDDGGCKADKFERDERLLRLDLAEKNDTRSRFYLAETLRTLGRKNEAKALYDERARVEDFPEEAWMARHMAARCCDGAEADLRAIEAYFTRPQRLESLVDAAKRACDSGRHHLAMGLADLARDRSAPTTETLWVDAPAYRWGMAYVAMVSAFYCGRKADGMSACDYLHLTNESPYSHMALENVRFYAEPVPGERKPLPFTPPEGFVPMNPSLHAIGNGQWLGLIRCVNYRINDLGQYLTADGQYFTMTTPIITRNFIQLYDADLTPVDVAIELQTPPSPQAGARIRGFEDLRFVTYQPFLGIITTAGVRLDANDREVPEYWEAVWNADGKLLTSRRISEAGKVEKNWLPIISDVDGGIGYLYGHSPLTTVDTNGSVIHQVATTLNLSAFRGSAAPIPYSGGRLWVVHEVTTPGGGKRVYLHRFVWAKGDGIWVSPPFLMRGRPCIECCFSINKVDGGVLMTCSWEDREVYTITVPDSHFHGLVQSWTHGRTHALPAPGKTVS
jgi:hypothetical protein